LPSQALGFAAQPGWASVHASGVYTLSWLALFSRRKALRFSDLLTGPHSSIVSMRCAFPLIYTSSLLNFSEALKNCSNATVEGVASLIFRKSGKIKVALDTKLIPELSDK
jgi:hypothetical protein